MNVLDECFFPEKYSCALNVISTFSFYYYISTHFVSQDTT